MSVFSQEVQVNGTVITDGSAVVQPVSGPLTDTQLRAVPVPISGTVSIGAPTTAATITNISVGTSVSTLSASNIAKKRVVIHNETGTLFVKLGTAASSTSYSYRLTANTLLEVNEYAGIITAIKASGTSPVLVTEIGI